MSNDNALEPARDTAEWNGAWDVLRRLAAARRLALHDLQTSDAAVRDIKDGPSLALAADVQTPVPPNSIAVDSAQYARAIAEIEQASAALRRAEPGLEAWLPESVAANEPRHSRSVWVLIGGVWIGTVLVVSGAIVATLFLFS